MYKVQICIVVYAHVWMRVGPKLASKWICLCLLEELADDGSHLDELVPVQNRGLAVYMCAPNKQSGCFRS